jgi:hypothetical protein
MTKALQDPGGKLLDSLGLVTGRLEIGDESEFRHAGLYSRKIDGVNKSEDRAHGQERDIYPY